MVTLPLFVLLIVICAVLIKAGSVKAGAVVLGLLLGLTMASTAAGPPLIDAMQSATTATVHALSSMFGGNRA